MKDRIHPLPASERTMLPKAGAGRFTVVLPWDLDDRLSAQHLYRLVVECEFYHLVF